MDTIVIPSVFIAGIIASVIAAFVSSRFLPWVVGGLGLVTGFLNWQAGNEIVLLISIGLVVALDSIVQQTFNPKWLTQTVFFVKVYFAHVLLACATLFVLKVIF
jgi:hypothetical protein